MSEKSKTANGRAAQLMGTVVQTFATSSDGISEVLDMRGFSKVSAVFPEGSSATDVLRLGLALSATSTAQMSSGALDIMTLTGTSGGAMGSTAVTWPYAYLTSTSTAATLYMSMI